MKKPNDNCKHCSGSGVYYHTVNGVPFAVYCHCTWENNTSYDKEESQQSLDFTVNGRIPSQ